MKTLVAFFVAAFLLISVTAFSQKSVFENAGLAKAGDGLPCVQLAWKKGSENTAFYLVERSSDSVEFRQIALVFTAEDEQFSHYKFSDKAYALAGSSAYYRIAIVNDQKELRYLPVKKVKTSAAELSVLTQHSAGAPASKN